MIDLRDEDRLRRAVLALGEAEMDGLYESLVTLLRVLKGGNNPFLGGGCADLSSSLGDSTAIVSTNIDDLAKRTGLDELQLHGSTGRLQCAPCDIDEAMEALTSNVAEYVLI